MVGGERTGGTGEGGKIKNHGPVLHIEKKSGGWVNQLSKRGERKLETGVTVNKHRETWGVGREWGGEKRMNFPLLVNAERIKGN